MLSKLIKRREAPVPNETCAQIAGRLFASGMNCAQAVLQATTGTDDPKMMEMARAFGGGIGNSKCLCGAVTGGVMALGLSGKSGQAGELMAMFKETHRVTCCSALTRGYLWKSSEHLANCRRITEGTAGMVEQLMKR